MWPDAQIMKKMDHTQIAYLWFSRSLGIHKIVSEVEKRMHWSAYSNAAISRTILRYQNAINSEFSVCGFYNQFLSDWNFSRNWEMLSRNSSSSFKLNWLTCYSYMWMPSNWYCLWKNGRWSKEHANLIESRSCALIVNSVISGECGKFYRLPLSCFVKLSFRNFETFWGESCK